MARALTIVHAGLALMATAVHAAGPADPFSAPTRPAAADAAAPVATSLAGVRLGRQPSALIDGTWHAIGSTVRGARLSAIDVVGVRLQHADGRIEHLPLYAAPPTPPAATSGEVTLRTVPRRGQP